MNHLTIPEFGWIMVEYFWPVLILALPGLVLLGRDIIKGAMLYVERHKQAKASNSNQMEDELGEVTEREHPELPLAQI